MMKNIMIMGSGDADCIKLEQRTVQAAEELGIPYELSKVTQIATILSYGVIMAPGLVVDDKVRSVGRIPTVEELKSILTTEIEDEPLPPEDEEREEIISREEY